MQSWFQLVQGDYNKWLTKEQEQVLSPSFRSKPRSERDRICQDASFHSFAITTNIWLQIILDLLATSSEATYAMFRVLKQSRASKKDVRALQQAIARYERTFGYLEMRQSREKLLTYVTR
jgi:hypothetical protein